MHGELVSWCVPLDMSKDHVFVYLFIFILLRNFHSVMNQTKINDIRLD